MCLRVVETVVEGMFRFERGVKVESQRQINQVKVKAVETATKLKISSLLRVLYIYLYKHFYCCLQHSLQDVCISSTTTITTITTSTTISYSTYYYNFLSYRPKHSPKMTFPHHSFSPHLYLTNFHDQDIAHRTSLHPT